MTHCKVYTPQYHEQSERTHHIGFHILLIKGLCKNYLEGGGGVGKLEGGIGENDNKREGGLM